MVNLIQFFSELGKLKSIKRVGWILGGVKPSEAESIADHSFRLALMSWYFAEKKGLDVDKVIKMSLIHDLCIIYTGDITPYGNLLTGDLKKDREIVAKWPRRSKEEKEKIAHERKAKERKAFEQLSELLSDKFGEEVKDLWVEYEEGKSKEGRFLRQIDRVEKLLQATEYKDSKKYLSPINPFWVQLKELVDDKDLIEFIEGLDDYFFNQTSHHDESQKDLVSNR